MFLRECAFVQSRLGLVARIHEKSGVKTSIEFNGISPLFSVGPVHYRFGLIYILTLFIVNMSKIMITYYHLKALIRLY